MKILFIYPAFESLALEYLSAVAKSKGHKVEMAFDPNLFNDSYISSAALSRFFSMRHETIEKVIFHKPDLIAFSVVTTDFMWFQSIGKLIRNYTTAYMIAGNAHVTAAPEAVLGLGIIDAIVRGEGEQAFSDVLDSIEAGGMNHDIPNLGLMSDGSMRLNQLRTPMENLDDLPLPDKTIYENTPIWTKDMYSIMASRGCPFNCTFCSNNLMQNLYGGGNYLRHRSVDNVIDEISYAKRVHKPRFINFLDLTMGVNKRWLGEFAEKYARLIGLPYFVSTNPGIVTHEYADMLAQSGCIGADIGVQTINQEKRRTIFNRFETNEQIRQTITILKERGIKVGAENIMNFPGETESDLIDLTNFYNEMRPDSIKVYWLYYFPGTKIIDIALEKGAITPQFADDIRNGKQIGSPTICGRVTKVQKNIHLILMMQLMLPKSFISFLIAHRLYRKMPAGFLARYVYLIFRIVFRKKSPESDILFKQSKRRYIFYIKYFIKSRLRISKH